MPITVGAIRKLRADAKKTGENLKTKRAYKEAVSTMRKEPTEKLLAEVFSKLDRAAKRGVIHRNKAGRLKSRLAKLLAKKDTKKKR
jgi:small subunit ribosomal protein S20